MRAPLLALNPSWRLALALSAIYAAVLVAVLLSMAPSWLKAAASILLVGQACYVFVTKVSLKSSKSIVHIIPKEKGPWRLGLKHGTFYDAHLSGDSFVSRYAMILNFIPTVGRRRSVLIVPEMLGKENFRKLFILSQLKQGGV